jgi:hypothetical protein
MEGAEPTLIVAVAVLIQPAAEAPVTVYTVLEDGLAVKLAVVAPVFQVYVLAPLAVIVPVEPAQIVADVDATFGRLFTITLNVLVFVQPKVFVPVTV